MPKGLRAKLRERERLQRTASEQRIDEGDFFIGTAAGEALDLLRRQQLRLQQHTRQGGGRRL
jgi:RNA polymerase-binding transcription factor DksA